MAWTSLNGDQQLNLHDFPRGWGRDPKKKGWANLAGALAARLDYLASGLLGNPPQRGNSG
ncbi:hypothetical protein ASPCADRAFT_135643 [Aspergillus carbonarius ITEM 5010]|uniref:Uncharacterized protein n=1 Tax=Aspergillus carbonarius (strain ITEM 5010) TaxID=602072 RepID=A0A1R3R5V6_ASPC5|nr:hypothetical protein ASPCADRAFT_135643 [Aspergillus carbonarius ITEM 5010]